MSTSATATATTEQTGTKPADVIVRGNASGFLQEIVSGAHQLRADEPIDVGGGDAAPGPYDYVLVGLGACTSMTVGLYARTKKWPLENISVSLRHSRIHAKDCAECETKEGMLDRIDVEIGLSGALTPEQRAKLMDVAAKCPVHRTIKSEINIRLRTAPSGSLSESTTTKIQSRPTQTGK
jgi:putative redox protein